MFFNENVVKNIMRRDILTSLQKNYNMLEENLIHGQQLAKTGSWTYDIEADEVFLSNEVYNILDCGLEDFNGHPEDFYRFIHPDDLDAIRNATQKAFQGEAFEIKYRVISLKGVEKYIYGKVKILYDDESHSPTKVIGIMQDITHQKLIEKNLSEIGEDLIQAQRVASVGSWKYDIKNKKLFGSEEFYRIYGADPVEFQKNDEKLIHLIHPEDQSRLRAAIIKCLNGATFQLEYRIPQGDGSVKYVLSNGEPLLDKDGGVKGMLGTIQDITARREMENTIRSKQKEIDRIHKRMEVMIQNSSDVFEIIQVDGTIKYMSAAAEKVIGYKPEERIGKNLFDYYSDEDIEKIKKMTNYVLKNPTKEVHGDILLKNKEGKEIYLEVHLQNFLHDPDIAGIIVNFRDITRRIMMEKRMAYLSTHDDLTGLPNHKYYNKRLKLQCKNAEDTSAKFSVMMLDVGKLKYVNYSFGFEFGKKLIIEIVNRLKSTLGKDIFISRYSDDHFALIVEGLGTYKENAKLAEKIIHDFSKPFHVDQYNIDLTVNIGICTYPKDAQDCNSLMKQSRIALARAKKEGKNTYKFYSPDLDVQNYKEFILKSDLHNAIEKDQLEVYYQPIMQLKTNRIIAAEALIRWKHPDWGTINPNEFIYIAEEMDFIIDIGKWMLKEVCKNYLQWLSKGYPKIKVSLNYSIIQFFERDFIEHIIRIIHDHGLDPHFLIIEITESILMKNLDKTMTDIKHLQSAGIQVAIDDFGTGYSSLAYLRDLDIDILKLDRSFIKDFTTDYKRNVILKSIVNLAKELKIKMVAEGIET